MPAKLRTALSPQEIRILRCLRDGLSSKEIARSLSIREKTVDWHVRNVLEKLGVRNRAHAVAVALATGVVEPLPQHSHHRASR